MIDAHHHFWHPARGDYGWMPADDPVLSRPYSPQDLAPGLADTGVTKTVLVQAAPSVAETEYLLGIADATPHVARVVGWVDFENPADRATLARLAQHPKFAGVRPMIQDLPDDGWMLRRDVQWGFEALVELDLTFDCLGFPQHLKNFHTLLTTHPDLRAVIDHCMKPQLRLTEPEHKRNWQFGMERLAAETDVYCKLSGLVTEADNDWSDTVLRPYTHTVITAFGADRVMWGSDWPVVGLRCTYSEWHAQAKRVVASYDADMQIFDATARSFYRIDA